MHRSFFIIFLLLLGISATRVFGQAEVRGFTIPAKTTAPFTYCIWYLPDPDKPVFLDELRTSPPDLFHLGYQIPFKGALGPTFGHDLFSNDILPPDQIPREVQRVQNIIQQMREAGVARLIPYVYTMAFFGQSDQRTGFFHFYDNWEQYRDFGLGPKPKADPTLWSQERGPAQLGGGPTGIMHFEPCINHPAWAEYLDLVVRQLAGVGYDGMFFDVNTLYCYCPHCEEKFDIFLLQKYGKKGLREVFGTDDHRRLNLSTIYRDFEAAILPAFKPYLAQIWDAENLTQVLDAKDTSEIKLEEDWRLLRCFMQQSRAEFPPAGSAFKPFLRQQFGGETMAQVSLAKKNRFQQMVLRYYFHQFLESPSLAGLLQHRFGSADIRRRCCGTPEALHLWVETQRFWCASMAEQFARLKAIGRTVFDEQGRQDDFYTVANLGSMATMDALNKRRVDGIDLVHWAPTADLQMYEEMTQSGSLESGVIMSNIFAFRWAMGAGTRAGTLLYKAVDDRAADLAHAEAAAGGGGAFIECALNAPDSRRRWKRFFADHADFWDDGDSRAQVGILFWSDQIFYEAPEHYALTQQWVHIFSENQIPFDIVTEENPHSLDQYQMIVAPGLRYLSDAQIEKLLAYSRQGGRLVVIEPFGLADKFAKPRATDPLAEICPAAGDWHSVDYGKGQILRIAAVPARQSDFWCLMEERANAYVLAREYLNQSRQTDLAQKIDLGAGFVQRLEQTLQTPLRWCPNGTDAGIYLHAYHIPAKTGRPERMIVHVVNYRVPIILEKGAGEDGEMAWSSVTKAGVPKICRNLQISVPLPSGTRVKTVSAYSPTETPRRLVWSANETHARVKVKQLEIYQALVLEVEAGAVGGRD